MPHHSEQALRESESRYRKLFQNMTSGFAYCKMIFNEESQPVDFIYVEVNSAFERSTGLKDVVGKKVSELIPGLNESNPELLEIYGRVALTGKPETFETEVSALGLHFSVSAYSLKDGYFGAVFDDITARKRAEAAVEQYKQRLEKLVDERTEALRNSNRFLDSVIENIPNMIFVKDAKDLRFARFNKAGEELLGFSRSELIGKNDYDFFPKTEADFFTSKDRAVLAGGQILDIPEEQIRTRLKGERILHTKKIPILGKSNEPEYLLGISEDITDKLQLEENRRQLVQAQLAQEEAQKGIVVRDEFLSIASHELKTPLTSLYMQLQLVARFFKDPQKVDREKAGFLLGKSLKACEQLNLMLNELLDMTRIRAGKLVLNRRETDFRVALTETVLQISEEIAKSGSSVEVIAEEPVMGQWDPNRILQVVSNLLSNALKYGEGKPIVVSLKRDSAANSVRLQVKDHGIGIAPDVQKIIFERFERGVSVDKISGLGLGLYIVRMIVEAHSGRVWVESDAEVGGALFTVELPLSGNH